MWQLLDTHPLVRMSIGMFFAILLGAAIGPAPVVPIRAGVSVALVLAMGPESAGGTRLVDVLLGASVGLLFSRCSLRLIHSATLGVQPPTSCVRLVMDWIECYEPVRCKAVREQRPL